MDKDYELITIPEETPHTDTDKSQFIVHPEGVRNLDFRYGSGVYDKSAPHGTIIKLN